mgnify:CR=1 FL=1
MMIEETIEKENEMLEKMEKKLERVFHPKLEGHNKSIRWVFETVKNLDAEINVIDKTGWDNRFEFYIKMNGKYSNIKYKIEVKYNPDAADVLANRIDKIDIEEKNYYILKNILKKIIEIRVYWYDPSELKWEYTCIDRNDEIYWPGDFIVSLMNCLYNDLFTIMDFQMNTLRNTVSMALPMQWLIGELDDVFDLETVNELLWDYSMIDTLNPNDSMELIESTKKNISRILLSKTKTL